VDGGDLPVALDHSTHPDRELGLHPRRMPVARASQVSWRNDRRHHRLLALLAHLAAARTPVGVRVSRPGTTRLLPLHPGWETYVDAGATARCSPLSRSSRARSRPRQVPTPTSWAPIRPPAPASPPPRRASSCASTKTSSPEAHGSRC